MAVIIKNKSYTIQDIGEYQGDGVILFMLNGTIVHQIDFTAGESLTVEDIFSGIEGQTNMSTEYSESEYVSISGDDYDSILWSQAMVEFAIDIGFSGIIYNDDVMDYMITGKDPIFWGLSRIVLKEYPMKNIFFSFQRTNYFKTTFTTHFNGTVSRRKNGKLPITYSIKIGGIQCEQIKYIEQILNNIGSNQSWKIYAVEEDGFPVPGDKCQVALSDQDFEQSDDSGEYHVTIVVAEEL